MINPNYKSRSDDFKRLFKDLPDSERLIVGEYFSSLDVVIKGGRGY